VGLSQYEIDNVDMPVPPPAEQTAIAAFLDRETCKIDALIAEQRRLIELLQEKRQAVISHAVTKGLDPDAPMKDSGIEWLGMVPEHWDVKRIGAMFATVTESGSDELPILSVSIHDGVSDKEMSEDEMERKVTRSDDRSKYVRVAPRDLVYNMMRAWQGGFGTVTTEGMVSPAYVVARPRTDCETRFVELVLRTPQAIEQMRRCSRGITDFRMRLYWDEFKCLVLPVPPKSDVSAILEGIEGMANQYTTLENEASAAIALLQERRSALISAAVTGQIDVRHLADSGAA
jgi:type I restriction enzyme S subunit